ncbi:hypothetical protein [Streptomyces bohaiensis]|uniref:hypothetical protein n=1 Tax=Streptomyces bohaiensis TaxID=1431344 RepID=UPI003B77EA5D
MRTTYLKIETAPGTDLKVTHIRKADLPRSTHTPSHAYYWEIGEEHQRIIGHPGIQGTRLHREAWADEYEQCQRRAMEARKHAMAAVANFALADMTAAFGYTNGEPAVCVAEPGLGREFIAIALSDVSPGRIGPPQFHKPADAGAPSTKRSAAAPFVRIATDWTGAPVTVALSEDEPTAHLAPNETVWKLNGDSAKLVAHPAQLTPRPKADGARWDESLSEQLWATHRFESSARRVQSTLLGQGLLTHLGWADGAYGVVIHSGQAIYAAVASEFCWRGVKYQPVQHALDLGYLAGGDATADQVAYAISRTIS